MSIAGSAPVFDPKQPWRIVSGNVPGCPVGTVVTLATRGHLFDVSRPWAGLAASLDLRAATVTLSADGHECVVRSSAGDVAFVRSEGGFSAASGVIAAPAYPRALPSEFGLPNQSKYLEGSWISPGYRSGRTRARWLEAFFVVMMLASFWMLLLAVQSFSMATRAVGGNLPTEAQAAALATTLRNGTDLYGLCIIALIIAFFAWSSRTVDNVPPLAGGTPRESPRSTVGWWFVPIVDFWKPYTIFRELWDRLSVPARPAGGWIVLGWWVTLIGAFLVDKLAAAMASNTGSWSTLQLADGIELVSAVAYVAAAALGFLMVREIQARADLRATALGLDARPATLPFDPATALAPSWATGSSQPVQAPSPMPPAPVAAPAAPGMGESLRSLNQLRDEGLVTDEEYAAKRSEILGRL